MVSKNFHKTLGIEKSVIVIAEIGQNHQGDIDIAKKLIKAAKESGADCVKFQKSYLEEKFNKKALCRPYKNKNSWGETYGEHKQHLEFSEEEFIELQNFSIEVGIIFSASAMDARSLDFLVSIKVPFIKIGSGDANNLLLLEEAAKKRIPLIISTGMQTFSTIKSIYSCISKYHKNFALLHCVSAYPPPINELNLRVIELYKQTFPDIDIGYSGHEEGIFASTVAVSLGASIIERHFTLDKSWKGTDHKCSLVPDEFRALISAINTTIIALGKPIKQIQLSEQVCYQKLGKSIVAAENIPQGTKLSKKHMKIKVAEPKGIDGIFLYEIIGRKTKKDLCEDDSLRYEDLEN